MWREQYKKVLENVCYANLNNFPKKIDLEKPSFFNIEYLNDDAPIDALYRFALDEEVATEKDYKDFVEYIANYIDVPIDKLLDIAKGRKQQFSNFRENQFSSFGEDKEPTNNRFFFG